MRTGFSPVQDLAARQLRFEALLSESVYEAAWRFAYRLSPSREDAEDLLQEALAQAYARLGQLRDHGSFKPWLFAIIRHRAYRLGARRRRDSELLALDQSAEALLPGVEVQSLELAAALSGLPAEQREILLLHYLDGLSLAEAGIALGCSERAAKQRLYRARGSLRTALSGTRTQADFSALL